MDLAKLRQLNVHLLRPLLKGTGNFAKTVALAFIAMVNVYSMMRAIASGVPVISVAVFNQYHWGGIVSLEGNPIRKPEDLKGKKIAVLLGTSHESFYKALLKRNNIKREEVEEVITPQTTQLLLAKKVDGCNATLYHAPVLVECAGEVPISLAYGDYSTEGYGANIIVHKDSVADNPETIRAFLRASIKGWQYAKNHQEETVNIILESQPSADRKYVAKSLALLLPTLTSADTEKLGLFAQSMEGWDNAQNIMFDSGEIQINWIPRLYFTNAFLPSEK